ncbi:hypothetical protein N2152v2_004822 [Parachlorella kessleri]
MTDPLFSVRNNYYIGAYQKAVSEASQLTGLSEHEKIERDVFVYRSYIELGSYELVLAEISSSSPMALQAVRQLALYLKDGSQREAVLAQVASWLTDMSCTNNATVLLVAGLVFLLEENYVEALKCCHNGLNLEMLALCVQCYLKMERPDQAEKQAKAMAGVDDDATLTQLATAWVNVYLGGAKVQEAFYIYQELGDKFTWTVRLHNGLAVCQMRMGRWEEAEAELLQAFEKNPKDADTLANLVVVSLHLGKNSSRYLGQLRVVAPSHLMSKRYDAGEELFERAASAVTA